jgi:hypothetical protein
MYRAGKSRQYRAWRRKQFATMRTVGAVSRAPDATRRSNHIGAGTELILKMNTLVEVDQSADAVKIAARLLTRNWNWIEPAFGLSILETALLI